MATNTNRVISRALANLRAAGLVQDFTWYSSALGEEVDTLISGSLQPPTTYNVYSHQYGASDETNNIMIYTDTVSDRTGMKIMKGDILYTKVTDFDFFLGSKTQIEQFIVPNTLSITRKSDSTAYTLNEDYEYESRTGIIQRIAPSVGNGDIVGTVTKGLVADSTYSNTQVSSGQIELIDDTAVGTFKSPLMFLPPNCTWNDITVTASITDCTVTIGVYENARSGTLNALGSIVDGANTFSLSSYDDTRALCIYIQIGIPTPITGSVLINISTGTADLTLNTIGAECLASYYKDRMVVDSVNEMMGYIKCHREVLR